MKKVLNCGIILAKSNLLEGKETYPLFFAYQHKLIIYIYINTFFKMLCIFKILTNFA